jgi:uncharacterized protein (TIGR02597 family)
MKIIRPSVIPVIIALACSLAHAQTTATTDPVGFVSYTVNANSDQKMGVPMTQANVFAGSATAVSGATITSTSVPALSGKNLLLVTTGAAAGSWEEISSATSSSIVLQAPIADFTSGDVFEVRPFWTLGTLLPNGGAVPASPDPESPLGLVLVNDPMATGINQASGASYLYHDGSVLEPAGWYANGTFEPANDVVITPESFVTVRNLSSSNVNVVITGNVPVRPSTIEVVSRAAGQQDNLIPNQFPAAVSLANSGLNTSGAVAPSPDPENPTDLLLVYSLSNNGLNPASSASYFYHDGSVLEPAGWYSNGTFEFANDVEIPAGGAIIIRKAAGTAQVTNFTPSLPYSL